MMPDRDIQEKTKSGLQALTKGMQSLLGPFAIPGQKDIRDEYLQSLGIDPANVKSTITSRLTLNTRMACACRAIAGSSPKASTPTSANS